MVDSVYRTRSLGVGATGLKDQYADGKAARVWQSYIGDTSTRTANYRHWLRDLLKHYEADTVLDVACGTGIDSIVLLEEGFTVTSIDASDKMLKHALKTRWQRRKEEAFDKWVIEEGNWLALPQSEIEIPNSGFDAVLCLGNSFPHLPDFRGDQADQKLALANFYDILKPGGILIIDHRNYDEIIKSGTLPQEKNIYYNSKDSNLKDIKTSVLHVNGKPTMVTLDYIIATEDAACDAGEAYQSDKKEPDNSKFRLSYYPHLVDNFTELLQNTFGSNAKHEIFGDFKSYKKDSGKPPLFFIHVIQKPL
ncbi:uncharacterized protein TRIADDRAFT_59780 [Trichoplax adhaerens]|uniref:Glycine N-methyltransferase n=1 Tax=Trichoplax adhaerens TaxID=10228 RepID=B3S6E8_TRIAD|nr:hypothetical protein TRIADDRAFT_59780 [Trichoplax adhaerens]EDV21746.1 hypothetical protein TRIADDRAFT_59780 [Trichoplax adhaerens]|eukprot:XP_002115894.1 hypothetical protein TRIADDRAFT_59780 [Trichoplax adhaerens]